MMDSDEPPPRPSLSRRGSNEKSGLKRVLVGPDWNQFVPPAGLRVKGKFERLGILNPAVVQDDFNKNLITLFPRLIYKDEKGVSSCIVKRTGVLEGYSVRLNNDEIVAFQAGSPHGRKGVEDFRAGKLLGEDPLHGFLVYYNGFDARTGYVRTSQEYPSDYSKWEDFGIYFPNISARDAISLVKLDRYKESWGAAYGQKTLAEAAKSGRKDLPRNPFLGVKDCCLFPRKVDINGELKYGIVIRLLPDIQIVYVKSFEDLARKAFWRGVVSNLEDCLLLERKYEWEKSHIGAAGSFLEIEEGILMDYHGARMVPKRDYRGGRVLLDKENPQKVLARTKKPIYSATETWEEGGVVDGKIVFPTGYAVSKEGIVHGFYGAADKVIGHITTNAEKLLDGLE